MRTKTLFCCLMQLFFINLNAVNQDSYLDLSTGYRSDRISCLVDVFDPPSVLIASDDIKIKHLSIYQLGGKARFTFCNSWFIRGNAYYGWALDGKYKETVTSGKTASVFEAKAHKGNTVDATVGGGYLYSFNDCWAIGPAAGWSYDHQKAKMSHGFLGETPETFLDGLTYKNRWSGPWLGVDFLFRRCNFIVHGGYEFHWAHWHAEWLLKGADIPHVAFSDVRHSKHAHGNLVYLDGRWEFSPCWHIGVGLQWQGWCAKHGRLHPKFTTLKAMGFPNEVDKVKHAKWHSAAITVDLGYGF